MVSSDAVLMKQAVEPLWNAPIWDEVMIACMIRLSDFPVVAWVCVARASATSPKIILLMSQSQLDPISARLKKLLYGLKDRYTMFWWHVPCNKCRISDKTAFFLDGDLTEYQWYNEMFLNPV